MNDNRTNQVQRHILRQIERDKNELDKLDPQLDWYKTVMWTAETSIPRIVEAAKPLMLHVESSLNSPFLVRAIWQRVKDGLEDKKLIVEMEDALRREQRLLSVIAGETISKVIADFLCGLHSDWAQNNRSTYPDLYFSTMDYSKLPKRKRGLAKGPAVKGGKLTSVPDGIEIKSNRGLRVRVDCHHDHQGLRLAFTFTQDREMWKAHDVYLAYLSKADYKRAERNTTATTDKFSFGHAPFVSVTTGQIEEGLLEEVTD